MKLRTKNFRLNALANRYSAALYHEVRQQNGGDWFTVEAGEITIHVAIVGGIKGMRQLVDAYCLKALQENYPRWESVAIELLSRCLDGDALTDNGREIWQGMRDDMGAMAARQGGQFDA